MSRTKPWKVSEELWEQVDKLLPARAPRDPGKTYQRKPGGGRSGVDRRKVFEAIVRVLRTGCQWNSISKKRDGVSSSSVHRRFLEWTRAGVFLELWRKGLAEYDELEGIAWEWQSIDATQTKAALAQEAVGPNPTGRGKKWDKDKRPDRRRWSPAVSIHNRRERPRVNRGESGDRSESGPPTGRRGGA
jgi:transposase